MKKLLLFNILFLATVLLAGCNSQGPVSKSDTPVEAPAVMEADEAIDTDTLEDSAIDQVPAMSTDDNLDSIKKDLDDTQIFEENFSDL